VYGGVDSGLEIENYGGAIMKSRGPQWSEMIVVRASHRANGSTRVNADTVQFLKPEMFGL